MKIKNVFMNNNKNNLWPRAIILVDMNSFFAAIEQLDFPQLQNQPVAVTNGEQGTCIITSSYEARAYGVKTGMRLLEARKLCPQLIQRPARPQRYAEISRSIMNALQDITPDVEIFSVDEAFLDVTRCQKLLGTPEKIGRLTQQKIWDVSHLPCSIGISGDKTTAKYAAELKKPNGFNIILPWEAKQHLANISVTELCGIGEGIAAFLAKYGVYTCGDMQRLPIGILAQRFGNLGRKIWYMCQGQDPTPVKTLVPDPKSMGHGKVIPPNTIDMELIKTYFLHMSEKLAIRLRRHHMQAQHFFVGVLSYRLGWIGTRIKLAYPSHDSQVLFTMCMQVLQQHWQGEPVNQVQLTALDPQPIGMQLDLFTVMQDNRARLNKTIDNVNARYGEFAIAPARLLLRSKMPNVISPAWQPNGHRQTV